MAERDDDADVVCHVETSAGHLAAEPMRTKKVLLTAREPVEGEEDGHKKAEERDHLVGWKAGLPDELDERIR